ERMDAPAREEGVKMLAVVRPLMTTGSAPAGNRAAQVATAVSAFDATLEPLIRRSTLQMVMKSDVVTLETTNSVVLLVAEQVASLSAVLRVQGRTNLLASLIGQAANSPSPQHLAQIQGALQETASAMQTALADVRTATDLAQVRSHVALLQRLAQA